MNKRGKSKQIEWVGGLASMPAYVTGEGEPYRPDMLFWLDADGAIIGHRTDLPGTLIPQVCESLKEAIHNPLFGRPHWPTRIRVASPEMATALREGFPSLEIACAPTPEVDAVVEGFRQSMGNDDDETASYLSADVGPDRMAALFRAAAALYRAAPWSAIPGDDGLIGVTIASHGVSGGVLSVIGQLGESFGWILFSSMHEFEEFAAAAETIAANEIDNFPMMPPHLSLNFDRGSDLPAPLRKEIADHRWEVASAAAYPTLLSIDEDLVQRPLSLDQVTIAEAIALALPEFLNAGAEVVAAPQGGEPVERSLRVRTYEGEVEVRLSFPARGGSPVFGPSDDLVAMMDELEIEGDEIDFDALFPLIQELERRYRASPEAEGLEDTGEVGLLMDLAANYLDVTVASMQAADLEELLLDVYPRKVSVKASEASSIIEQTRAFYRFLKREFDLPQADDCLDGLGGDLVSRLKAALSDRSKFGMAKSLFMGGDGAGLDPFAMGPAQPRGKAKDKSKAKKQRKAARKARKKNR